MPRPTLVVSAVCFRDTEGRILTVRKRGTSKFMLPGGKLETDESPADAAVREIREEIGVELAVADLTLLGEWTTDAANEPDTSVTGTVYTARLTAEPVASAEIDEVRWVVPGDPDLAPLLRERVMPALGLA
ncbi:MAG: hypothetical protein RI885_233 [Actinomycetota bacterium]|jgi:8-oxo-dGTP pyrophosphatase MutT (NUDIX family)